MKAISSEIIITSISSRADGSLGFRCVTPELTNDAKVAFMELQNLNVKAIFQPMDSMPDTLVTVGKELDTKTPCQRLRGVLFVYFRQTNPESQEFDSFYRTEMEKIINNFKNKLEPSTF